MELEFCESYICDNEIDKAIRDSGISIRIRGECRMNGIRSWVLEGDSNVMLRFLKEYNKIKCKNYDFDKL
jgi:hypothetical protein